MEDWRRWDSFRLNVITIIINAAKVLDLPTTQSNFQPSSEHFLPAGMITNYYQQST